jgi:uncharacterized protein YecT (DUF1311 family)
VALSGAVATEAAVFPPEALDVRFGKGRSELEGALASGDVARYTFDARDDQWAEVEMGSEDGNAKLDIHGPGWRLDPDGKVLPGKGTLQAIARDDGELSWAGLPPWTGTYLLEVRAVDGDATFELEVILRAPAKADCEELPQQPMNVCFGLIARQAEGARARAYDDLLGVVDGKERGQLEAAEKAWRAYRDAECRQEAGRYEGGSLAPTIHASCVIGLTEERTRLLERLRKETDDS